MIKSNNSNKSKLSFLNGVSFVFLTYLSLSSSHGLASSSSKDSGEEIQLVEQPKVLSQNLSAVLFPSSSNIQVENSVDEDGYVTITEKGNRTKTKPTALDRDVRNGKFMAAWGKFYPKALKLFQIECTDEEKRSFSGEVWTHVKNKDNFPKNRATITLFMKSLNLLIDGYGIHSTHASNALSRVVEDHPLLQSNLPSIYDVYNRTLITRLDDLIKTTKDLMEEKITSLVTMDFPEYNYVKESNQTTSEETFLDKCIKDYRSEKAWNKFFPIAYKLFTIKAPRQEIEQFSKDILDFIHDERRFLKFAGLKYLFMKSLGLSTTFDNLRISEDSFKIVSWKVNQEHPLLGEEKKDPFIYDVYNKICLMRIDNIVPMKPVIGVKRTDMEAELIRANPFAKKPATLMGPVDGPTDSIDINSEINAASSIILLPEQSSEISCPTPPADQFQADSDTDNDSDSDSDDEPILRIVE